MNSTGRYPELIVLRKCPETPDQAIAGQNQHYLPVRGSGLRGVLVDHQRGDDRMYTGLLSNQCAQELTIGVIHSASCSRRLVTCNQPLSKEEVVMADRAGVAENSIRHLGKSKGQICCGV